MINGLRGLKLGIAVMLLPLLGSCDYFRSFEAICQARLAPASVVAQAEPMQVQTDFTLSIEQLSAKGAASTGRLVLGLVETKLAGSVEFTAQGIVKPFSGRYCMRPSLAVKLAFKPTTLYVASQHAPGSCEFDITMAHEQKHIRVYQSYLDELAREVETELRGKLGGDIVYFDSVAAGEAQLRERAATLLRPFLDRGGDEVAKRQAKVDTPEEYFFLESFQARCGS
ncbi:MAG: hypothetical protein ACKVQK_11785 [Burkholderiales bacterium]